MFHGLGHRAPNAFSLLNVQVTEAGHISPADLAAKLRPDDDRVIRIGYVGRATAIKGRFVWLATIARFKEWGCRFHSTWAGDGDDLPAMQRFVADRGPGDVCTLAGKLKRADARRLIAESDIFLFCHLIQESPRCLVEALSLGTPTVGCDSQNSHELVAEAGAA